jgi:hypothetical protein
VRRTLKRLQAFQIVNAMNSKKKNCDSNYGHFVVDSKAGLGLMGNSKFVHMKREANLTAHVIAKAACNQVTDFI